MDIRIRFSKLRPEEVDEEKPAIEWKYSEEEDSNAPAFLDPAQADQAGYTDAEWSETEENVGFLRRRFGKLLRAKSTPEKPTAKVIDSSV